MQETITEFDFFYGHNHPLSQWFYSDFEINDKVFNCCEQWMMYSKAMLFNDINKANEILKEPSPSLQRKLGRQVRFFRNDIWIINRREIVKQGNVAKFSQNYILRNYLIDTSDKILAEASPTDLVWGIGLSETDPKRYDKNNWKGMNLLGEILMEIRINLKTYEWQNKF